MDKFIHIRSPKFPILPGENEELVNEGMYGKAAAEYLQLKLRERGYEVPFVCCEDWGWWVELKNAPFECAVDLEKDYDKQVLAKRAPERLFSSLIGTFSFPLLPHRPSWLCRPLSSTLVSPPTTSRLS